MPKILHFFSTFSSMGGVESILRLHAERDAQNGIDSVMVIACESLDARYSIPVIGLGIRGWHTVAELRRRFRGILASQRPQQIVFHNAWACRHLVDLIGEAQCILMIHTDSEESREAIRKCRGFSDLVLSVSRPIGRFVETQVASERSVVLDYPIEPPEWSPLPRKEGPWRIGYIGRLITEQKRVERLPALMMAVRKTGLNFTFELLGDGHYRDNLERELPGICPTDFRGRLGGTDYWLALKSWDFIVFTSDYEGTPISLIEALSQGIIPIYPAIGSGGDDLIAGVEPQLLYPAGDLEAAALACQRVTELNPEQRQALQMRLAAAVSRNRPAVYFQEFRTALEATSPLPNRLAPRSRLASFPLCALPFAAVRRLSSHLIY